jgi:hypothetical protein
MWPAAVINIIFGETLRVLPKASLLSQCAIDCIAVPTLDHRPYPILGWMAPHMSGRWAASLGVLAKAEPDHPKPADITRLAGESIAAASSVAEVHTQGANRGFLHRSGVGTKRT